MVGHDGLLVARQGAQARLGRAAGRVGRGDLTEDRAAVRRAGGADPALLRQGGGGDEAREGDGAQDAKRVHD